MLSSEIRKKYLDFFASKGHTIVASDSLIPKGDPTLLFTTAGMVQFKPLYGGAPLQFSRAASCQKCLRAGGKGSDLENVGKTVRHHTFFEMLGNFSFGDYFKEEAIDWAWEFLTEVVKLPKDLLWPSVFRDDDEAFQFWNKKIGLPANRIVRLGEKDNFWGPAGDSGACGPSSEIYYDLGVKRGCGKPNCAPGCDCERYIEIWNLVFPQFDQQTDGTRKPLARRGIDTGMGLERISFISQGAENNYQSDLFKPVIAEIGKHASEAYGPQTRMAYHVIADHVRALTFAIGDQVVPSNEGRGYVMRRILRRADRYAQKVGIQGPVLYKLVATVVDIMKSVYPELVKVREDIAKVIKAEEEKFLGTISFGLTMLEDLIKSSDSKVVSGQDLFRLYDTYGFPLEMAKELAEEEGFQIDEKGFQEEMVKQKEKSRGSWVGKTQVQKTVALEELKAKLGQTEFLGYENLSSEGKILTLLKDEIEVKEANKGEKVDVILNRSPFYGESGGQVGDKGIIKTSHGEVEIVDVQSPVEGLTVHTGVVKKGIIQSGEESFADVDAALRFATARHHTATHLLHYALRKVLGAHVRQAGSWVSPDRFRFDFTHFSKVGHSELESIESLINEKVIENTVLKSMVVSMEEAKQRGALMFFGDKYGSIVRMIDIGGYSLELCGGTHVKATGEIGLFKFLAESSVASGVRRVEAVSGLKAYESIRQTEQTFTELCSLMSASSGEILERMEKLLAEKKKLEKELAHQQLSQAKNVFEEMLKNPMKVSDVFVYQAVFHDLDTDGLRSIHDDIKSKVASGLVLLASKQTDKVLFLCQVTPDLVKKGLHAGKIVQNLAIQVGGGGGGKPDLAQAGGKNPEKLQEALNSIPGLVQNLIKN